MISDAIRFLLWIVFSAILQMIDFVFSLIRDVGSFYFTSTNSYIEMSRTIFWVMLPVAICFAVLYKYVTGIGKNEKPDFERQAKSFLIGIVISIAFPAILMGAMYAGNQLNKNAQNIFSSGDLNVSTHILSATAKTKLIDLNAVKVEGDAPTEETTEENIQLSQITDINKGGENNYEFYPDTATLLIAVVFGLVALVISVYLLIKIISRAFRIVVNFFFAWIPISQYISGDQEALGPWAGELTTDVVMGMMFPFVMPVVLGVSRTILADTGSDYQFNSVAQMFMLLAGLSFLGTIDVIVSNRFGTNNKAGQQSGMMAMLGAGMVWNSMGNALGGLKNMIGGSNSKTDNADVDIDAEVDNQDEDMNLNDDNDSADNDPMSDDDNMGGNDELNDVGAEIDEQQDITFDENPSFDSIEDPQANSRDFGNDNDYSSNMFDDDAPVFKENGMAKEIDFDKYKVDIGDFK